MKLLGLSKSSTKTVKKIIDAMEEHQVIRTHEYYDRSTGGTGEKKRTIRLLMNVNKKGDENNEQARTENSENEDTKQKCKVDFPVFT